MCTKNIKTIKYKVVQEPWAKWDEIVPQKSLYLLATDILKLSWGHYLNEQNQTQSHSLSTSVWFSLLTLFQWIPVHLLINIWIIEPNLSNDSGTQSLNHSLYFFFWKNILLNTIFSFAIALLYKIRNHEYISYVFTLQCLKTTL